MISSTDQRAWSEAAGQLRYLSIRLQGFVAELPTQSVPPRGHVPWSATEVGELVVLTRVLGRGEEDAAEAAASLAAIDTLFRRGRVEAGEAANVAFTADLAVAHRRSEAALLEHYLAHRTVAIESLSRLQRFGDAPGESHSIGRSTTRRASRWRLLWARALGRLHPRRP